MLIVKIMSGEDTHDHDSRKGFTIHSGVRFACFERIGDGTTDDVKTFVRPWLTLHFVDPTADSVSFEPQGNVYVMNERGVTVANYGVAPIIRAAELAVRPPDDNRIDTIVDRFLAWRLPERFNPDNGIVFRPPAEGPNRAGEWPSGTNLFDYTQATAMVRHILNEPEAS